MGLMRLLVRVLLNWCYQAASTCTRNTGSGPACKSGGIGRTGPKIPTAAWQISCDATIRKRSLSPLYRAGSFTGWELSDNSGFQRSPWFYDFQRHWRLYYPSLDDVSIYYYKQIYYFYNQLLYFILTLTVFRYCTKLIPNGAQNNETIGFLDPSQLSDTAIKFAGEHSLSYLTDSLLKLQDKNLVFLPCHKDG